MLRLSLTLVWLYIIQPLGWRVSDAFTDDVIIVCVNTERQSSRMPCAELVIYLPAALPFDSSPPLDQDAKPSMNERLRNPAISRTLPLRNEFDEDAYVLLHPDVAAAIDSGIVGSGWQHFTLHGFAERRQWVPKADSLLGVFQDIAPGDEMYRENEAHYFDVGESAMRCIETALFAARRPKASVAKILDLPCGYGRVMRFLRKEFPDAQLTACDLHRDGIDFCARKFGARPVISQVEAEKVQLFKEFDLIWCGSLLTHLAKEKCASFIQLFQRLLRPGGIVVFTTHGRCCEIELSTGKNRCGLNEQQIAKLLQDYSRIGFGYVDYLAQSGYGISLALPSYVMANFVQHPEWRLLGYHEAGWDKRQDAIYLQRLGT